MKTWRSGNYSNTEIICTRGKERRNVRDGLPSPISINLRIVSFLEDFPKSNSLSNLFEIGLGSTPIMQFGVQKPFLQGIRGLNRHLLLAGQSNPYKGLL